LYSYLDDNNSPPAGPVYPKYPSIEAAGVLTATDLKITEQYGKTCADGCIPGGALNPEAVGKIEAIVQVITSTTGRRYGFNPNGKKSGPYGANDAALRVVHNAVTYNLDVNTTNIINSAYLSSLNVGLDAMTQIGVSSKFLTPLTPITVAPDNLYGSIADKFVIQDSWWGNGGTAFEYFAGEKVITLSSGGTKTFLAKHIYRLDYLNKLDPVAEDVGLFDGAIDAIGVDGFGNLYVLSTELTPANLPAWPSSAGLPQVPSFPAADPNPLLTSDPKYSAQTPWYRPGVGGPDTPIIGSPLQSGDYKKFFYMQSVKKVCRKYTPSAGGGYSLSTVEERGAVDTEFDMLVRTLRFDGGTSYSWLNDWGYVYPSVLERKASVEGEFAVVNIAQRPEVYHPPAECSYSICRDDRIKPDVVISEGAQVTFKVEG
ncbi:hypothetical protein HYY75_01490, partial [bacterium]|nr:hypothetical protein [bacterium]